MKLNLNITIDLNPGDTIQFMEQTYLIESVVDEDTIVVIPTHNSVPARTTLKKLLVKSFQLKRVGQTRRLWRIHNQDGHLKRSLTYRPGVLTQRIQA